MQTGEEESGFETYFLDFASVEVGDFIAGSRDSGTSHPLELLKSVHDRIRDGILYDPYRIPLDPQYYRASRIARMKRSYCIPKAILFAACARRLGFASRIGFADVINHLSTPRLLEHLGTSVFAFHGYAEVCIEGRWVKATPVFDRRLCAKFGVPALEFDGVHDAIFQAFDASGQRFMEYVKDRGVYSDFPFDYVMQGFREAYPRRFSQDARVSPGDEVNQV